jgi:hypothetical protein
LLAALGDVSFAGERADSPTAALFKAAQAAWFNADIVIANLEGPLTDRGTTVRGKCTIRGAPGWAQVLKNAGIQIVSLGNNHMMDYGPDGLFKTIDALDAAGVHYLGAGRNRQAACAPLYLKTADVKIGVLARTSVIVSSSCYATEFEPGVAFLDSGETRRAISTLRKNVDLLVVLLHWGIEEHFYPAPRQRELARMFVAAGADLIIGHHPHVLQGLERMGQSIVAYSLGNFVMDDFNWEMLTADGSTVAKSIQPKPANRIGLILQIPWEGGHIGSPDYVLTRFPRGGNVQLLNRTEAQKRMRRLEKRLSFPFYSLFWHLYAARMEWRLRLRPRMFGEKNWKHLTKLRPRHLMELLKLARRSARVASGRSTNPYE